MVKRVDDDIDALFTLPLAEFTSARNALAAQLKKSGRPNEADRVKLLSKPSVSAWAVNQLYWDHRKAFDQLIATGKRVRSGGKPADMRESLEARREALADLSELATELLTEAGHNPSLDTMRRITTTLEALSAYAMLPDGPTPGRLTQDVDPPSFELLATLISGGGAIERKEERPRAKLSIVPSSKINAAKVALQNAKKSLSDARARAQTLETEHKKASAEAKETEKYRRKAAEHLEKATAAAEDASRRSQTAAAELDEANTALEEAKRRIEKATKELESLLQER